MVQAKKLWIAVLLFFTLKAQGAVPAVGAAIDSCSDVFVPTSLDYLHSRVNSTSRISSDQLTRHVLNKINEVLEFKFIRSLSEKMGIRVWLFGGSASSFLHYAKWDLVSSQDLHQLQPNRFTFEFSSIFRSTQDIDIVVDASAETALRFESILMSRFPHFLGKKDNHWEVRTLRTRIGIQGEKGYKEALLDDMDFQLQNTDSNSIGMIELSDSNGEPLIRDLKTWDQPKSIFLEDAIHDRISFFRSSEHFQTSRARAGENPEILSVLRVLVKSFQYGLSLNLKDLIKMREIVSQFNPLGMIHPLAKKRIKDTAKKLVLHASDVEFAINQLDKLGLREKLISMGNRYEVDSFAWWLNREPLRSRPVGEIQSGPTAQELQIKIVSHETKSFLASEVITRTLSGEPNAFISRSSATGETALHGDGFYTTLGRVSTVGTGLTIRFSVDPNARSGSDFIYFPVQRFVLFTNKKALKLIPESLSLEIDDFLQIVESDRNSEIHHSDRRLLEMQVLKFNSALFIHEIETLLYSQKDEDFKKLIRILLAMHSAKGAQFISENVIKNVIKSIFNEIKDWGSSKDASLTEKYISIVDASLETLESLHLIKTSDVINVLGKILASKSTEFRLRKAAFFSLLTLAHQTAGLPSAQEFFSQEEVKTIQGEFWSWNESSDLRKKRVVRRIRSTWSTAVERGQVTVLEQLIKSRLFDLHSELPGQFSILQLASYYDQILILDWLIHHQDFDFNHKDSLGYTEVEQLILKGKNEWVHEIQRQLPNGITRDLRLIERYTDQRTMDYPQGVPIVDFVRIEPGTFFMDIGEDQVLTTITQPFEMMSVDVTQKTYQQVIHLLKRYGNNDYTHLNHLLRLKFSGESLPVYHISYDEVVSWVRGLNELSGLSVSEVQETLMNLFPRHSLGDVYQIPTEAQWEMVSRLGGVAEGDYSHSKTDMDLHDYAVFRPYYGDIQENLVPVGSKKPVFYYGKPIYDLHGLIWRWMSDWYEVHLVGGIDPKGPAHGAMKVLRGGSFRDTAYQARSYQRRALLPDQTEVYAGFRLVRVLER